MPAWSVLVSLLACLAIPSAAAFPAFLSRGISPAGETFYRETLLPADIDGDGDGDFFGGEGRGGRQFRFENPGPFDSAWIRRPVHDSNKADVGAARLYRPRRKRLSLRHVPLRRKRVPA